MCKKCSSLALVEIDEALNYAIEAKKSVLDIHKPTIDAFIDELLDARNELQSAITTALGDS